MRSTVLTAAVVAVLALGLAGCGSMPFFGSSSSSNGAPEAPAAEEKPAVEEKKPEA